MGKYKTKLESIREANMRLENKLINESTSKSINETIDPETEMRMVSKMKDSFYNMQSNMGRIGHAIEELVLQKKSFRSNDKEQLETLYRFLSRFSEDTNQATEVLKRFLQEKYS